MWYMSSHSQETANRRSTRPAGEIELASVVDFWRKKENAIRIFFIPNAHNPLKSPDSKK
jgi:hypothetical protein